MRVIVTGGSGRAGRITVQELVAAGHEVVNLDVVRPPADLPGGFLQLDLTDAGEVYDVLSQIRPEGVCHLAANPSPTGFPPSAVFRKSVALPRLPELQRTGPWRGLDLPLQPPTVHPWACGLLGGLCEPVAPVPFASVAASGCYSVVKDRSAFRLGTYTSAEVAGLFVPAFRADEPCGPPPVVARWPTELSKFFRACQVSWPLMPSSPLRGEIPIRRRSRGCDAVSTIG